MTALDHLGSGCIVAPSLIRRRFLGAVAGDPTTTEQSVVGANGTGSTGAKATFPAEPVS